MLENIYARTPDTADTEELGQAESGRPISARPCAKSGIGLAEAVRNTAAADAEKQKEADFWSQPVKQAWDIFRLCDFE